MLDFSRPIDGDRASLDEARSPGSAKEVRAGERSAPIEEVAQQLRAIRGLSRATLVERWTEAYGRPPPKGLSRRLLEYAAAYQVQLAAFGGLSPSLRRALRRIAEPKPNGSRSVTPKMTVSRSPPPGTRLIREWHGRVYTVETLEHGFACDGGTFRSLSEVARYITGAHWSGPRFFGT